MVKGKKIQYTITKEDPPVSYRKIDALSHSMLKIFDSDPVRFYEEFKLGKKRKESKSISTIIGDIVHFYLLECGADDAEFHNRLEEKFVICEGIEQNRQVYVLADYIFEEAQNHMNERGEISVSFDTLFTNAFNRIKQEGKYRGKDINKAMEDFYLNAKDYYDKKIDSVGKTVVDYPLIEKAKFTALRIMNDSFTKDIFCRSVGTDYFTHFTIQWNYPLPNRGSYPCKSEVDIIMIDHKNRSIRLFDIKTTYDNEVFDYSYIKNGYYLQNGFYVRAAEEWAKEADIYGYTVEPMVFIVGDTSSNNRRPLIYETSGTDVERAIYGFRLRGRYYRGVDELVNDIVWAESNNIWDCSREAYERNGRITLKVDYEDP